MAGTKESPDNGLTGLERLRHRIKNRIAALCLNRSLCGHEIESIFKELDGGIPLPEHISLAINQIKSDEGFSREVYACPTGHMTIGYGWNLENGIRYEEALFRLENDVDDAERMLSLTITNYNKLSAVRKSVLINMVINLGMTGLLKFENMIRAVEAGDYKAAANEMLQSKWAAQAHDRAKRLAFAMAEDKYD